LEMVASQLCRNQGHSKDDGEGGSDLNARIVGLEVACKLQPLSSAVGSDITF
jgi:hypothetical protein